ncbi:peptide deformylase [Rhizosphaericola mali]|uniref:Peptide deformylase n=1 Tax=Rhizosphaericola mali TaxID=2545455 RepID=A0A5P2G6B6_9BACT|nr:peptide deformylase [Rhizosphaericola mali]QES90857.1 peptide deformylase [Rhizosphaericola mali]
MILPIIGYGANILREKCIDIDKDYPKLEELIANFWETLYSSNGVGLAAPQVNLNIRMFVVDSAQIFESLEPGDETYADAPGIKQVFLNAHIIERTGEEWPYQEGCLSIPGIREDVFRPEEVEIEYVDENFVAHRKKFNGITARIIQHEYDHIDGKLFIDYLKPLKRKLLHRKLDNITKGNVKVDYRMKFAKKK